MRPGLRASILAAASLVLAAIALPAQAQLCEVLNELGACTPSAPPDLEYTGDGRIILPGVPSTDGGSLPPPPSVPTERPEIARQLLSQANQERARVGAPALTSRDDLVGLATSQTRKMLGTGGGLLHNLDLVTRPLLDRLGAVVAGENVGWSTHVEDIHPRFMASPGHRAALLDPRFTVAGFAVIQDTDGLYYVTQDFIQPRGAAPAAAAPAAPATSAAAAPAPTAGPPANPAPAGAPGTPAGVAPAGTGDAAAGSSSDGAPPATAAPVPTTGATPATAVGGDGQRLAQGAVAGVLADPVSSTTTPLALVVTAVALLAAAAAGQARWWARHQG
ncbi:MAG TPA: CAP domain-containing protein [Acidimicrobiales bacterium]|nr:CAP domain-containing protein [Acidimicrobiales bacterium]